MRTRGVVNSKKSSYTLIFFRKNPKKFPKIHKIPKNSTKSKNSKKSPKIPKNPQKFQKIKKNPPKIPKKLKNYSITDQQNDQASIFFVIDSNSHYFLLLGNTTLLPGWAFLSVSYDRHF